MPIWRRLLRQAVARPASFALLNAGNSRPASTPITARTTNSSISVKADQSGVSCPLSVVLLMNPKVLPASCRQRDRRKALLARCRQHLGGTVSFVRVIMGIAPLTTDLVGSGPVTFD